MDEVLVEVARSGDEPAFGRLTQPYRHQLQVHCYRMLGSIEDAEDAVQETLLRAWARIDSFAGRASFRAWLYGIATNVCLDALRRKRSRVWPADLVAPADPGDYRLVATDLPWLQPYPDRLLEAAAPAEAEPEAAVIARETIEIAFLAAIQRLPSRQRAVLILRDVLDWSVKDTATALEMTPAAVNSALQRARAALGEHLPGPRTDWRLTSTPSERALLDQFVRAWERADTAGLVGLLRQDAGLVMPPTLAWFAGRAAIGRFFREHVFSPDVGHWRLLPTAANRQPAFALYWQEPGATDYRPFAIGALRVEGAAIAEISLFVDAALFAPFALPATL